jgi:hypothetical protein
MSERQWERERERERERKNIIFYNNIVLVD